MEKINFTLVNIKTTIEWCNKHCDLQRPADELRALKATFRNYAILASIYGYHEKTKDPTYILQEFTQGAWLMPNHPLCEWNDRNIAGLPNANDNPDGCCAACPMKNRWPTGHPTIQRVSKCVRLLSLVRDLFVGEPRPQVWGSVCQTLTEEISLVISGH